MLARTLVLAVLVGVPASADAQVARVNYAGGEVTLAADDRRARLARRVPGIPPEWRARVLVSGDTAQHLALSDFDWRGRVLSLELDESDTRIFWDVKIVPDGTRETIVRYRVDAASGGILSIREFTGIRKITP